jgi:putative ABC transport system permease protein
MLVAGEAALSLVLLCGAALLLRSFVQLLSVDPGFRVANTLTFVISQPQNPAGNELLRPSTVDQLRQRLAALPGVRSAAAVNHIPVAGDEWGTTFHIPGVTPEDRFQRPRAIWRLVDPHYLTTMGMTLRSGRPFGLHDIAGAEPVALINQALASRWFPNRNPVGQPFVIGGDERRTIVGVFADTRQRVWGEPADFEMLLPVAQERDWTRTRFISFALHTSVDPNTLFETVRRTVSEFNPNLALYDMATMDQVRSAAVARPRFTLSLLCGLAAVTLALAIVGLFAVVSYSVATRTREFGIRSALGAASSRIAAQVVCEALLPVGAGALAGLGGGLLLMRQYRDLLYRVDPADPIALGGAVVLILCVALAACWLPARRASRVHPATVLRDE